MFALSYAILVLVAALPLAITLVQHRGAPTSPALIHRIYRDVAYIAAAVFAIIVLARQVAIGLTAPAGATPRAFFDQSALYPAAAK